MTCILLVLVVLIQSGKGAEISASFSGSSQTVFGSSGGANFFTHFTQGAAALFMITSLTLTIMGGQSKKSLFEGVAPATPAAQTQAPSAAKPADTAAPVAGGAKTEAAPQAPAAAAPSGQ